jgi:hypothetical protein
MEPGLLALFGVFALAALCALWRWRHGRAIDRRLAELGFEPCDAEAPSLEAAWRAVAARDGPRELRLLHCRRRPAGWGMLHRFTVRERPSPDRTSDDTPSPGSTYPAYLLDVRDPDSLCRGAVTLHVLPPGSKLVRKLLAGLIDLSSARPRIEVGAHPWSAWIVAAQGDAPGKLDERMPAAVQEKLARAAAHGFFIVHLGGGKAAFAVLPSHRDVDRELAYLAEWA